MTPCVLNVLGETHDLSGFDCADDRLTVWLRQAARPEQAAGTSQTYVWTKPGDAQVLAYFAICPTFVAPEGLGKRIASGFDGGLPGFLLAKLALDRTLRGSTPRHGGELLLDALEKIVQAADLAGGRIIIVDTLNDAARAFYERASFQLVGQTDRLYMKVSTARQTLGNS